MEDLPAELLSQITALRDQNALLRLRGVNKYLNDVVTPLAFECVYVGWILKHFQHLESLANSSVAKHVRCLTINTEILPFLHKKRWMESVRSTMCNTIESLRIPEEWVEDDLDSAELYNILRSQYSKDEIFMNWEKFPTSRGSNRNGAQKSARCL
jgi:hypothetical protein